MRVTRNQLQILLSILEREGKNEVEIKTTNEGKPQFFVVVEKLELLRLNKRPKA